MTIFVGKRKMWDEDSAKFISEQDKLLRQIVRAWHKLEIKHYFENEGRFQKAIRRNLTTLESPDTIKTLFKSTNYLFSTKAKDHKETLYFEDKAAKQTGRLRQQHRKGPLAKIDKKARTHLFLSEVRFKCLKEWDYKKKGLPCFCPSEEVCRTGKRHIEFAYDGKEVSGWHHSRGTVKKDKKNLKGRIAFALKDILGLNRKVLKSFPRARHKIFSK